MQQPNFTTNAIELNALEDIGFMPGANDIITPRQKDIFDFSTSLDSLKGSSIADELKSAKTEPAKTDTEYQEEKVDTEEKKEPKIKPEDINTLADDISKTITESAKVDPADQQQEPQKEEIKSKTGLVKFLKARIEKGGFQPFSDYDEKQSLADYLNGKTMGDLEELIEKNYEVREGKIKEDYASEFYESLPGHLKFVAQHLAEGTLDPQSVYAALSRVEQARPLNPADEHDQVTIAQNYLAAINFGTPELVEAQIEEWKEADILGKKAAQFKPMLDKMEEEQVAAYAHQAEEFKKQQQQAAEWYAHSVQDALKDADLNGIKLSRKHQKQIYDDMLINMKPSVRTGQPMNALWSKLEHIQVVEPDFKLLAAITFHANHPEEFYELIRQQGRNDQQAKVTKELKTLQGSSSASEDIQEQKKTTRKGIVKQRNPFDI